MKYVKVNIYNILNQNYWFASIYGLNDILRQIRYFNFENQEISVIYFFDDNDFLKERLALNGFQKDEYYYL